MTDVRWHIRALEFGNCNCAYGCPCQFNSLPTNGNCCAVVAFQIEEGRHGEVKLDGLKVVSVVAWPGPIHKGGGEAAIIVDERADEAQRNAILRIFSGQDTEPGATIFSVFAATLEKTHEPIFADIQFQIDIDKRRARVAVSGLVESLGEPILNPVTGAEHRARIEIPKGFEYRIAEVGRGWSETKLPLKFKLTDSHSQFCRVNLSQSGVID